MAVLHTDLPLTRAEFYALDRSGIYRHTELIAGDLVFQYGRYEDGRFVNSPAALHQRVVIQLAIQLGLWSRGADGNGEVLHELDQEIPNATGDVLKPDLAWWPEARCGPRDAAPAFSGPPALVVEVLSPSTRRRDEGVKRQGYEDLGVDELWLIDPDRRRARVYRRDGERLGPTAELSAGQPLSSPALPGFTVTVGQLATR